VSARSTQSHRLAAALTDHFGMHVEMVYDGERDFHTKQHREFWRLSWTDGPTITTMRAEIGQRAARYPAVDVTGLRCSRSGTDQAQAAALLVWLPEHPEQIAAMAYVENTFVVESAFDDVEHPERLPEPIHQRAHALLSLDRGWLSLAVLRQLGQHCVHGWEQAEQWLDVLVARNTDHTLRAVRAVDNRATTSATTRDNLSDNVIDNVIDLNAARNRRDDQH
jgi:hypothetical protein